MLLVTLLCYLGFMALCLSMTRHYGELLHARLGLKRSRLLKLLGWSALVLSAWVAVSVEGWGMGLVQWFAALMASALALVFLIPYRPRLALILAAVGLLFSPVVAFNQLLV